MQTNLNEKAKEIRRLTLECIGSLGSGHVGGSLSLGDLLAVLYHDKMNIDPTNPKMEGRDRLVCSKGHAGPAIYAALASKGFIPVEQLKTLNKLGTDLPSHCDMNKTRGIDMTTGSLGQGLSLAVGAALGSKISKDNATIYCIIGDGESQEGQIWEAAMYAAHAKVDNLITFTDFNNLQIDGSIDEVNGLEKLDEKWLAFGWDVQRINGHDVDAIAAAIDKAKAVKGKPAMIILETTKGKGVPFIEEKKAGCHHMPLSGDDLAKALEALA
ncbi:transketolase [Oscillospiraceae bacterium MB08-C2-2]|nr:transketolase [Oscillospiraceae bacterium MB08-C2-2]